MENSSKGERERAQNFISNFYYQTEHDNFQKLVVEVRFYEDVNEMGRSH